MSVSSVQDNNPYNNIQANQVDPVKDPIAAWLINEGYSTEDALACEKQFDKTFEQQCQEILNQYSHVMEPLDPDNIENK